MTAYPYQSLNKPTWCPGCGNYGIFEALNRALSELALPTNKVVIVTDVGCSGNMADFLKTYVFHSLHGRALPIAAGIKLTNQDLTVITIIGDGGCYGEGLTHFINLMRGNHDIKVLVHDNFLYSLTTGQYSPTSPKGSITKSTPFGSIEEPFNPLAISLSNSASFVSRGYAFSIDHLKELIKKAILHQGFSLVDILQPCITFNKKQTLEWYQQKIFAIKQPFSDLKSAYKQAMNMDKLGIGIYFEKKALAYHQQDIVLKNQPLIKIDRNQIDITNLIKNFI